MSSQRVIAFFGVRRELSDEEIGKFELRSHPLFAQTREARLAIYWCCVSLSEMQYVVFIGEKLSIIGLENDRNFSISIVELLNRAGDTEMRLRSIGITDPPSIHIELEPDN